MFILFLFAVIILLTLLVIVLSLIYYISLYNKKKTINKANTDKTKNLNESKNDDPKINDDATDNVISYSFYASVPSKDIEILPEKPVTYTKQDIEFFIQNLSDVNDDNFYFSIQDVDNVTLKVKYDVSSEKYHIELPSNSGLYFIEVFEKIKMINVLDDYFEDIDIVQKYNFELSHDI